LKNRAATEVGSPPRTARQKRVLSTLDSQIGLVTRAKHDSNILRKSSLLLQKVIDRFRIRDHIDEGSKRFEEQQATGNVADRER
jgi:hypothetical protein